MVSIGRRRTFLRGLPGHGELFGFEVVGGSVGCWGPVVEEGIEGVEDMTVEWDEKLWWRFR